MFSQLFCKFIHTSAYRFNSIVPKSSLSALRKKTGYSFINCKKALIQFDNDLEKAEEWLHAEAQKQGWQKAEKLKGRETKQGLIGYLKLGNVASIVEVNCETDFAAKSSDFKDLITDVLTICHKHVVDKEFADSVMKVNISSSELKCLPWQEGKTIADRLALSVIKIGENLNARRATCIKFKDDFYLTGYAHPINQESDENSIQTGKYVGVVMYRRLTNSPPLSEFNKGLCQHIIGMNPKTVGEMGTAKDISIDETQEKKLEIVKNDEVEDSTPSKKDEANSSDESSSSDEDDVENEMFEETTLVNQKYISDPDKTVGEILEQASVQVVDFLRFECGQNLEENSIAE